MDIRVVKVECRAASDIPLTKTKLYQSFQSNPGVSITISVINTSLSPVTVFVGTK